MEEFAHVGFFASALYLPIELLLLPPFFFVALLCWRLIVSLLLHHLLILHLLPLLRQPQFAFLLYRGRRARHCDGAPRHCGRGLGGGAVGVAHDFAGGAAKARLQGPLRAFL